MDLGFRISDFRFEEGSAAHCSQFAIRKLKSELRNGISLIEVLISMFVLLFGLMGVAAIFPVGSHYVIEGEKFDLGSGIAQNAFEELKGRGMLQPEFWLYGDSVPGMIRPFIDAEGEFNLPIPDPHDSEFGPGHAFVIDPLGASSESASNNNLDLFPRAVDPSGNVIENNWWVNATTRGYNFDLAGTRWPVRRINLPVPNPSVPSAVLPMGGAVAETIFRLRDDLVVEQPDRADIPSIQRWDLADLNDTPDDLNDDTPLRRSYKGKYSWLASVVPVTSENLEALQPASPDYGEIRYDVSVVVFRNRDTTPSAGSERLINAELLVGGELVIYSDTSNGRVEVDDAVDGIRAGTWIALMGVNQTTGDFVMKWYRLLALDEVTVEENLPSTGNMVWLRRAMLIGPDWPASPGGLSFVPDLRAGFFPDAISVTTKPLKMEDFSLWKLE